MNLSCLSNARLTRGLFALTILGGPAATFVACDDSALTSPPSAEDPASTPDGGTQAAQAADGGTNLPPLYALGTTIFNQTSQTTYISLLDSLETQADITTANAREFAGFAPASAASGKLIVNDGETPKITRFAIAADKSWTEETSLGFGNYSQKALTPSIQFSDTTAFAPFDALGYVAWNPTSFTLGAEVPQPAAIPLKRDGLDVNRGYAHIVSGAYAYQTFYWANPAFTSLHGMSQIGVLDPATNAWIAAPEVGCPHMHIASKDDEGNLYFSPGQYSIIPAVVEAGAPKNCMVRIKAGQTTLDPTFNVKFADLAEGREGSNFYYVGNGIGFFNAYHAERDAAGIGTDPTKVLYSSSYHLWTYDLTTKTAKIMQGIDYAGGQYTSFRIDGRVFVAIPAGDYSTTSVYEIQPTGAAALRFKTQGWTFNIFRVR